MAEFKNIFIFVSDALRYDHIPESIAEEGKVIPTLTPGGYTPLSFSSMATGLDPRKHSVRTFYDTLEEKTAFEEFENHSMYYHPGDAICRNIFKHVNTSIEVEDLEEPFLYLERALDTHSPYGAIKHGNEIPDDVDRSGTLEERYQRGVESAEEHFWEDVQKLKDRGVFEDTLVIFTSDHGELLNEKRVFKTRNGHNEPLGKELNVVPTVFLNYDVDWDHMRTIDILPTALALTGRTMEDIDGVDLTSSEAPLKGYSMMNITSEPRIAIGCNWKWKDDEWQQTISKVKTDAGTLLKDFLDPIKDTLRDNDAVKKLRSNTEETSGPVAHIDV
jgi:phosphoglycerol transferase MdoB-like AlkP superfamily enzyme